MGTKLHTRMKLGAAATLTLVPGGVLQRKCACGGASGLAGECEGCRKKKLLQRRANGPAEPTEVPPIVHEVLRSPGQPLDPATRAFFEPRFGHDFCRVRVHTDARASESARAVNALAYTVGEDIAFSMEQYVPGTSMGRHLLAHELTHVVQQGGNLTQSPFSIGQPGDGCEREANQVASAIEGMDSGRRLSSGAPAGAMRAPASLQRLGANPTCTKAEAEGIHQAIFDARGWLNKVIPMLEESPLPAKALSSLRRNFGPTYGVAANAGLIHDRLKVGRGALGRIPFACDTAGTTELCKKQQCGWADAGSNAATICTNPPSTLDVAWPRAARCVLHEALHASMDFMTVDVYKEDPGYPGEGTDPLLNPASYEHFVMELS